MPMHELPITEKIIASCLRHAEKNAVTRILRIRLEIGGMSGLEPLWIQRYFGKLARGTIAEGAVLEVLPLPVRALCGACGGEYTADLRAAGPVLCPFCGSGAVRIVSGDEFRIKDMEAV